MAEHGPEAIAEGSSPTTSEITKAQTGAREARAGGDVVLTGLKDLGGTHTGERVFAEAQQTFNLAGLGGEGHEWDLSGGLVGTASASL